MPTSAPGCGGRSPPTSSATSPSWPAEAGPGRGGGGGGAALPRAEIELRPSRSSGPGGQHANVTASRVEAVFDIEASTSLDEARRVRLLEKLGPVVTAAAPA